MEEKIYIMPYCKECNKIKNQDWKNKNREKARNAVRKCYDKESTRERNIKYRNEGKQRRWQQENKDKIKKYGSMRINKKHMFSQSEWEECLNFFENSCSYCGMSNEDAKDIYDNVLHKEHVDHNGSNGIENCVPACKYCNSSKGTSDMYEWYKDQEFYSEERYNQILEWIELKSNFKATTNN